MLLCTSNVSFIFQGETYRQIDGVAMGSQWGPLLADIFGAKLEKQISNILKGLPLYKRYVDDILVISRSPAHTYELLATMNNLHPNIRFTVESEKNNQLAFLDISVDEQMDPFNVPSIVHALPQFYFYRF